MSESSMRSAMLLCGALSFVGATAHASPKALHGEDGRMDLNEAPTDLRALARRSVVAMMNSVYLQETATGYDYVYPGETLQSVYGVCADERFSQQPSWSSCSAVLIDDDLVLTAGHCTQSMYGQLDILPLGMPCATWRYVFDYAYADDGSLEALDKEDVYGCRGVVAIGSDTPGYLGLRDYAIVQLDRPVTSDRVPAEVIDALGPLTVGSGLTMIGFPSGLPMKIATGAHVLEDGLPHFPTFISNVDTLTGNSGSAVFDDSMRVVGILVAGPDPDYVPDGTCSRANRLPSEVAGEESTYARLAIDHLCDRGYASARLCGIAPACGDGQCTSGETVSCVSDCTGPPRCGDFFCDITEVGVGASACPADCVAPASDYRAREPASSSDKGCSASPSGRGASSALPFFAVALSALVRRRRALR